MARTKHDKGSGGDGLRFGKTSPPDLMPPDVPDEVRAALEGMGPTLSKNTLFVGEPGSGVNWAMKAWLRRQVASGAVASLHTPAPPQWRGEHYINWQTTGSAEGSVLVRTISESVTARMRHVGDDWSLLADCRPLVLALDDSLRAVADGEAPWNPDVHLHLERIVSLGRSVNVFVAASIRPGHLISIPNRIRDFFAQTVGCAEGRFGLIDGPISE